MKRQTITLIAGIIIGAMAFGTFALAADLIVVPSTQGVYVDGVQKTVDAYNINGSNYFKARDFAAAMDVSMWYNEETRNIMIETDKGYDANYTGTPVAHVPDTDERTGTEEDAEIVLETILKGLNITFEKVEMAASMVGAVSGVKFKTSDGAIELYKFDVNSPAYNLAVETNTITLSDFDLVLEVEIFGPYAIYFNNIDPAIQAAISGELQ